MGTAVGKKNHVERDNTQVEHDLAEAVAAATRAFTINQQIKSQPK